MVVVEGHNIKLLNTDMSFLLNEDKYEFSNHWEHLALRKFMKLELEDVRKNELVSKMQQDPLKFSVI